MKSKRYILCTALTVVSALMAVVPAQAQMPGDTTLVDMPFRKVAKKDIMGGVASVNVRQLTDKNYTTYSLDNMNGMVSGFNGAGMWGYTGQLILVDGVPREATTIRSEEIESITFLKGAQAVALYGSRAAQGAILITSKRGRVNKGLDIDVRVNTGWNVVKAFPEYLGSAEYMTLYNEARANDGLEPLYSAEQIYNYGSGLNPYRYPSIDFYSSDYVKKAYNTTEASTEIQGGNNRAKFYANVEYQRAGTLMNFGKAKDGYSDQLHVRGNVDININSSIDAYVNANATYSNNKGANHTGDKDFWAQTATLRPNRLTPLIPIDMIDPQALSALSLAQSSANIVDGKYILGGTQLDATNIFADQYASGTYKYTSRQFQFDAGVNIKLDALLRGLSFHTMMAIDYATAYTTSFNNTYATYEPTWARINGKDVIVGLDNHNTVDKKSGVQNISGSTDAQTITFNAHFDYNRTFGGVHNLSAILVANGYQTTKSGTYHRISNANLGLQASYNYAQRYYADAALATPWSAKLPSSKRLGFSPSLTLGWRLSNESWMKNSGFDDLTLSASVSNLKTDLGIDNYYMYLATYQSGGWWDWNGGTGHSAEQSKRGGNPDLNYLARKEFSVNLHGAVLNNSLSFDASYFLSKMTGGILLARNQMPSYFYSYYPESSFVPYINYNEDKRTGFDAAVNYRKQMGDWFVGAGLNLTYYTTKATKRDDTNYADAYQYRQGKPLDAIWGYQCLGFFKDEDDIANSPKQVIGGEIKPGDLKYVDQNNDGKIDSKDMVNLGKGGWYGAPTTLGLNVTLKYKNLTLFLLGTGTFGGHGVKNNSYYWARSEGKYSTVMRGRWTPETAATATYPRLTTTDGTNNYQTSSFWIYSTNRIDLQRVQLTYDFPKAFFGDSFVKGLSVYANGSSLFTIAKERKILEMNVGSAPQTRYFSLGAKVSF